MSGRNGGAGGAGHHTDHEGALARLGRACARHRWRTIGLWLVAIVAVVGVSRVAGGELVDEFSIPNSDAQRAFDLLEERFPARSGDSATLVFAAREGRLDDAAAREAVERALAAAAAVPGVESAGDPYATESGELSDDGRIAYADVQFDRPGFEVPKDDVERLEQDVLAAVAGSPVQAEFTGAVIGASEQPETGTSELLGLVAAVVILVIVFGSVVAMGLPILLALVALGTGLSLLMLAAAVTTFNTVTPTLATMLGLGVGIDYALFIVTRFRQALHDGLAPEDAAAAATATAGRAVIFAGATVAISISALAVIGLDFVTKLGVGAAITVVVAVLAAVTLLPAVLSLLGHRIDRGRVPFVKVQDDSYAARQRSLPARWARRVTRRPGLALALSLLILAVLATPAGWARLGSSDAGSNPTSTTTRRAYDLLAEGFGAGFNGPLLVAVDQRGAPEAADRLVATLRETDGIASVRDPSVNDEGDTALIVAYPTTAPDSERTADLVGHLRSDTIPATFAGTGARAFVGGQTAAFEDIAAQIFGRLPVFLLVAMGITFLILSMAFRSVVVAVKASLTTAASALAAFGVLVAVFQLGWGESVVGLDTTGPIESFLPVIVLAILFGLSTDYEVFLVSRIREEYVHGDEPRRAIIDGVGAIGRVVVAAALIMSVVFFSFVLGPDRIIKEFGVALGAAIVIDAFVVRLVFVPALMWLLGERAWYMPRWLDRLLPNLTIEPPVAETAASAPRGGGAAAPALGEAEPE
ncbi:MAG: MMPL family transporter [Thermoleophilia bacterium]|nr:MMPL family transporter [Thermoleophilia bacterium]